MKGQRKNSPKRAKGQQSKSGPERSVSQPLSDDEIQLLRRPEVPIQQWCKGEPVLGSRLERRLTRLLVGRKFQVPNYPIAGKAKLRKVIANDPKLVRDFEFFTNKLGWDPEALLHDLYWDCNMMHATLQTILASQSVGRDLKKAQKALSHIALLAKEVRTLNRTEFSPARTAILRNRKDELLRPAKQKYLLRVFSELPEILCCYGRELRRKFRLREASWVEEKTDCETIYKVTRQNSMYERIRAKVGKYHAVRLHRLVNAARHVQGFPPIELRAFIVWLNKLRKRSESTERFDAPTPPPTPGK